MTVTVAVVLVALGGTVGILVGTVGIGGVVLVPLLHFVLAMDVRAAIATSLFSYLFSGIVSVHLYRRYGSIDWRSAGPLGAGAVPGAFLGAATVDSIPAQGLLVAISILMVGAGLHGLAGPRGADRDLRSIPAAAMACLGFVIGFVSALTGTGGAVTLLPLLLAFGFAPLPAIGLGQVMQLPVAVSGSIRNFAAGNIDIEVATLLALGLAGGVAAGSRLAHALPTALLRRLTALLLLLFGTLVGVRSWPG